MKRFLGLTALMLICAGTSAATSYATANAVVQSAVVAADETAAPISYLVAFKPHKGGGGHKRGHKG